MITKEDFLRRFSPKRQLADVVNKLLIHLTSHQEHKTDSFRKVLNEGLSLISPHDSSRMIRLFYITDATDITLYTEGPLELVQHLEGSGYLPRNFRQGTALNMLKEVYNAKNSQILKESPSELDVLKGYIANTYGRVQDRKEKKVLFLNIRENFESVPLKLVSEALDVPLPTIKRWSMKYGRGEC